MTLHAAHNVLRRKRQRHRRVADRVRRVPDRRPRAGVVEHRVDEDAPARDLEDYRRASNVVRQSRVGSSTTVRVSGTAPNKGTVAASATVDGAIEYPNAANDTDSASLVVR
jgi:hypothetical protein